MEYNLVQFIYIRAGREENKYLDIKVDSNLTLLSNFKSVCYFSPFIVKKIQKEMSRKTKHFVFMKNKTEQL